MHGASAHSNRAAKNPFRRESHWPQPMIGILCALVPALAGCPSVPPPRSQVPDARAAIERLRASSSCGRGIQANAKADTFGEAGRLRGEVMLFAMQPASLRMDVVSPFGVALATLTSDGKDFRLADLKNKQFLVGYASPCNIAKLTAVRAPGHALVSMLRGQPPLLKHDPNAPTITWSGKGYYVIHIPSTREASEELHVAPHPDDRDREWSEQRMRLLQVIVRQYGDVLYDAKLSGHAAATMSGPRVDPDGIDPPIPPSGPMCRAEVPHEIKVDVPTDDQDVIFRYDKVSWNPPIPEGVFTQPQANGLELVQLRCPGED